MAESIDLCNSDSETEGSAATAAASASAVRTHRAQAATGTSALGKRSTSLSIFSGKSRDSAHLHATRRRTGSGASSAPLSSSTSETTALTVVPRPDGILALCHPEYETLDPTPDIFVLFQHFNALFFGGALDAVELKWSKRMTLCAGLCRYDSRGGACVIHLSQPLLSLRPRADLINTLLHEAIHAVLFVTKSLDDRSDHGPAFMRFAKAINQRAGTDITVFHSFNDEVDVYRTHIWRCDGPCATRAPYFGYVRRAMNRAPGPTDSWWTDHRAKCGGAYSKVAGPPPKPVAKGAGSKSAAPGGRNDGGSGSSLDGWIRKDGLSGDTHVSLTGKVSSDAGKRGAGADADFTRGTGSATVIRPASTSVVSGLGAKSPTTSSAPTHRAAPSAIVEAPRRPEVEARERRLLFAAAAQKRFASAREAASGVAASAAATAVAAVAAKSVGPRDAAASGTPREGFVVGAHHSDDVNAYDADDWKNEAGGGRDADDSCSTESVDLDALCS